MTENNSYVVMRDFLGANGKHYKKGDRVPIKEALEAEGLVAKNHPIILVLLSILALIVLIIVSIAPIP